MSDLFSILTSDVTEQQIIDAGYSKGITRKKLDGSEFLVQSDKVLPSELEEFVVVKDKSIEEMEIIVSGDDWTDKTGGL